MLLAKDMLPTKNLPETPKMGSGGICFGTYLDFASIFGMMDLDFEKCESAIQAILKSRTVAGESILDEEHGYSLFGQADLDHMKQAWYE